MGNWDDFQAVPDEFLNAGERVVVLGHFQGRGKASGKTLDALYAHGWTLRNGKAVHFRAYADTAKVLQSPG